MPSREPLVFQGTNYERHAHLHQCGRCGARWEEGERSAAEISEAQALDFLLGVKIDEKAQRILEDLTHSFDGPEVVYEFANDLHKFRVAGRPPHWLYLSRDFVNEHTEMEISELLPTDEMVEELKQAEHSRWVFIGEHGLRDVEEAFGRGDAL
jgi:hypothetical protein